MDRWPIHPLLVAAFPVLALWGQNVEEVTPGQALPVLGMVAVGVALVAAAASLALRDLRRGTLVASAFAALFLVYGYVWESAPTWLGLGVSVLVGVAAVQGVRRLDAGVGTATRILNVLGLSLVATSLVPIALSAAAADPADPTVPPSSVGDLRPEVVGTARDVYYIVPDRYPRADTLGDVFGADPTLQGMLEDRGFQVADHAMANYPKTAHSLVSTLHMEYVDELLGDVRPGLSGDWQALYSRLRDHRVGEVFDALGYEYLHLGNWWSPTQTSDQADVTLRYDTQSEFSQVFELTTMLPALEAAVGIDTSTDGRTLIRNHSRFQLDTLEGLAREEHDRPRFVLAHITLPHEPYVFDAEGGFVTADQEQARTRTENFTAQLRYLDERLVGIVDALLAGPDEDDPIIVIQSDEGPHPAPRVAAGPGYDWYVAPLPVLREKLRILSAYHLPGPGRDVTLPDDMTPVNTFRLIFDTYFGTDLGLLENRSYVFEDEEHLYDFRDVTAEVR